MNGEIFSFLKKYSSSPVLVDRLIVSAFLKINDRTVRYNDLLLKYVISETSTIEYGHLVNFERLIKNQTNNFDFENLIELFEFVVSPADKIVNGAVYTPRFIRNYIIDRLFERHYKPIDELFCADISCGCGGFLLNMAEKINRITGSTFANIFQTNLYGLDITEYSINRAKILLSLFALFHGEDDTFTFNLEIGNALSYKWQEKFPLLLENGGFDIVAGNPPYVTSRNMDEESLQLMSNWSVASTGHPDLYIPFFQIGYENLSPNGELGYITVNTFMKSINGRSLRDYFAENQIGIRILNFGGEQIFKGRNTYTCLFFTERDSSGIEYLRADSGQLSQISEVLFYRFSYENLNNRDGWNLVNNRQTEVFIRKIEGVGKPFKSLYATKNGIATLKNDVYKFTATKEEDDYYYFQDEGNQIVVEKAICRSIVNANKLKSTSDLLDKEEKIIFPYYVIDGIVKIIPQMEFIDKYPRAFEYLKSKKSLLAKRDKGKREYEEWYAYGRRQSMDINLYKLFFPHICERPTFVISEDKDLLFYNGIAAVSENKEDLLILKSLLQSDIFFDYIKATTKDYASGYISMSRNFIKNFGIYQMNPQEKLDLLSSKCPNDLINKWYGVV